MEKRKKENRFSGMTREETLRQARKQILRSAVMALAALIVIGIACYAWFVSSGTVTAITGPVTLNLDCFELASAGETGKYDDLVPNGIVGGEWKYGNLSGTQTSRNTDKNDKKQAILWRMTSENNLGNYDNEDIGIQPGDNGKLEFYVIRKQAGDLKINCSLDIIPYGKDGKELAEQDTSGAEGAEPSDEDRVRQLLRGHLLFYSTYTITTTDSEGNREETIKQQLADISDGSFQVELPAEMDEVKVTLNWYWPYFLRHAVEYYQNEEFAVKMRERVVDSLTKDQVNYFFTNSATEKYVGTGPDGDNDTRTVITRENVAKYAKRLGEYYNEADQVIGDNVDSIVLCLWAEAG